MYDQTRQCSIVSYMSQTVAEIDHVPMRGNEVGGHRVFPFQPMHCFADGDEASLDRCTVKRVALVIVQRSPGRAIEQQVARFQRVAKQFGRGRMLRKQLAAF